MNDVDKGLAEGIRETIDGYILDDIAKEAKQCKDCRWFSLYLRGEIAETCINKNCYKDIELKGTGDVLKAEVARNNTCHGDYWKERKRGR